MGIAANLLAIKARGVAAADISHTRGDPITVCSFLKSRIASVKKESQKTGDSSIWEGEPSAKSAIKLISLGN